MKVQFTWDDAIPPENLTPLENATRMLRLIDRPSLTVRVERKQWETGGVFYTASIEQSATGQHVKILCASSWHGLVERFDAFVFGVSFGGGRQ